MDFKVPKNRQYVVFNNFQGDALRVLTVCSAGCLRSPTAATILASEPFNFNTRSCGLTTEIAIVPITPTLLAWASVIVCMEEWMKRTVDDMLDELDKENHFGFNDKDRTVLNLDIPDHFGYMDMELQKIMLDKFKTIFIGEE